MPAKTAVVAAISAPLFAVASLAAVAGSHRRGSRLVHYVDMQGRPRWGTGQH
jgi:hypothetical protein